MSIHKVLMLGGEPVLVGTSPSQPKIPEQVKKITDRLIEEYAENTPWSPAVFFGVHAKDICRVIEAFCDEAINAHATELGEWLSITELDDIIIEQTVNMPQVFVDLCRWAVLARVGAYRSRQALGGIVAAMPVFSRPEPLVPELQKKFGTGQYAILHRTDDHLSFRGYSMTYANDGQWLLGGREGNRWIKNLWVTPGILPAALLHSRLVRFGPEYSRKLLARRAVAGISLDTFFKVTGSSLDLENSGLLVAGLQMLRAMLSYIEVKQADELLQCIAKAIDAPVTELIGNPDIAGESASDVRSQVRIRTQACEHFCYSGYIPMPGGYLPISDDIAFSGAVPIPGRRGLGIPVETLSRHPDVKYIRGDARQSIEIEDWAPVVRMCGQIIVGGVPATNIRESDGKVFYTDNQGDEHTILQRDYRDMSSVRVKPMIVDMRREMITDEDLRGSRHGISWELSNQDVNRRFMQKRKSGR